MDKSNNTISYDFLQEILNYNRETGVFVWKHRYDVPKQWNTKFAGNIAGHISLNGYVFISVNDKKYLAHRLAWVFAYGEWPSLEIDHIDGNPENNRIKNLRLATRLENGRNRKIQNSNKSGITGVCWDKENKRWKAYIWYNGKNKNLGLFFNIEDAIIERRKYESLYFDEFRRVL
jgi:hypothetical protein